MYRPHGLWLLLLLVLAAAAIAQTDNERIQRAIVLARSKQYSDAARALQGVPEPAGTGQRIAFHRLKAAIASGLGRRELAAEEMRAAAALAPDDAEVAAATAVAEFHAHLLDDALRRVHHLQAARDSAFLESLLGDIQEKRGDYVAAARAYQRAAELEPGNEQYRLNLALELVQHHTFEPAIEVLEQAAPSFPKSARLRVLLAVAYYAVGRVEEAVQILGAALTLDPSSAPAREYLGRIVLESSNPPGADAVEHLCARSSGGHEQAVCAAAQLRLDRGSTKAFETLKRLAAAKAADPVARCELGRAYEWREEWQEARREMEHCVRLDGSAQNHYRLARIYKRLGLDDLAHKESELQKEIAQAGAAEAERRRRAIEAFEYAIGR
jgi:tetratricopeptide (TPR) repeat protein